MRGYVIVLYTFAIYLVQGSHAFLPKFVYRVSKCPDPNNITEWEEASRKLVCLHPIRGGSSKQLSRVYHCLPSSFLNESVEYCGFSGAVTKGIVYYSALNSGRYCPVYSYGDGRNRAPTYRSCTNFTEGCPETQYHSKDVYMYPACLNINPIEKCYIAEPTCGKNYEIQDVTNITDISSTESDIEDDTNDNIALVGFICLLVIMAFSAVFVCILWKKKIIKCTVPTTDKDQQVHYDAVRQRASVGTGASGTNDDPLLQNNQREEADCDPLQQNGDVVREEETICNPLLPNGNTENPKDEKDEILHLNLDLFLEKVGRQITGKTLTKMKSHLKAKKNITESEMQMIDGIASGNDLINCLHRKYDFNINLYILQAILELTKEKRLATCCVKFAKNKRRMYYYEGHVDTRGYKEVILKLERNIEDYTEGDRECMRRHLLSLVNTSHPVDIVFKGIAKGCIAIHVLVRQTFVDMIKSADLSSLHDHYVVEVNVIGECKRILGGTGEKHIQEALLFTERDVSLSCFEVSFEFGPIALTTHKRVADKLQQHRKTMGMLDARNDSVIIIHHTKSDVYDIMLELFESEPIIHEERKYTCVQNDRLC